MKNVKKSMLRNALGSLLVIGAASSASSVIFAGDPVGSVARIFKISKTVPDPTVIVAGEKNSIPIAEGLIDSNTPDGFTITVDSGNEGVMRRVGGMLGEAGSNITYTAYQLKDVAGGKLGTDAMPFKTNPLTGADEGLSTFFSGDVRSATVSKKYQLLVEFTPTNDLLSGNYEDTITLELKAGI